MDYYKRLGVDKSASPEELKRAYKKLAMKHHPDKGGDQKMFQEINEAYDTLKDPDKKAHYDAPPRPEMNFNSQNMNDIFGAFFIQGKNIIGRYQLRSGEEVVANIHVPAGIESGQILQLAGLGDNYFKQLPRGNLLAKINVKSHPKYVRDRLHLRTFCSINVLELILGTETTIDKLGGGTIAIKIPPGTHPGTILSIPGYGIKDYKTQRTGNVYVEVKGTTPKLDRYEDLDRIRQLNDELNSRT